MRLFVTHGGQNSLLQAVYHGVPVLAIPLFGDQFDNVVRAEARGLGLSLRPSHITRERMGAAIQALTQRDRWSTGARGGTAGWLDATECLGESMEARKDGGVMNG